MTTNRRACPLRHPVLCSTLAALVAAAPARALWEAAEGEIFLSLDASIAADSNIASNSLELSDTIYSVTPGVSWQRSRGRGTISLSAACEVERASEYEGYDSENYSADFNLEMPVTAGGRINGTFDAGYFDGSRIDSSQNIRIAERAYDLGLNGSYQVSNKVNARLGAGYDKTEPEDLASYTSRSLTAGLGYLFRPQVSFFVDARFTDSSSEFSTLVGDSTSTWGNAVLAGLSGQITDKLSGTLGMGYDWSTSESAGVERDYSGITYDVGLTWTPRERTTLGLTASSGVHATSTGASESSNVGLTITQEIGLAVSADATVTLRQSDFSDNSQRSDDFVEASVGVRYAFSREISARLGYSYTDSDSTSVLTNYTRSVWELSASSRF